MILTDDNYYSPEANREYWSVSQFKAFNRCEACGLAQVRGEFEPELTDALLLGGYVDAYFSGEIARFMLENARYMTKKNGELLAKYEHANDAIERVESDPLMMQYLEGEKQTIMEAELFGLPWKAKFDIYNEKRIVDFKYVKDFADIRDPGYGYRSWIEYWGYDIQGAVYQKIEQLVTGRAEPLPFYIEAVTKEKIPDIKIIHIPQHILDAALGLVEAKIERFDLIKQGEVEPIRCEVCDYCRQTRVLKAPEEYEIKEAE